MAKPTHRHSDALLGFTIRVLARPGATPATEAAFASLLEQYMADRGLEISGGPLYSEVSSPERSLTTTDQVDLIDWLSAKTMLATVFLSPLAPVTHTPARADVDWIKADGADLTLIPLTWLYRCRRISADLFLQILCGPVPPALVH